MKNVERVPGTNFRALHSGNHGKYGNPHEQYKRVYRKASAAANLTVNSTTPTPWMQTTFTCPSPSMYEVEVYLDFLPSGGDGILTASVAVDGGAAEPKLIAVSNTVAARIPIFRKWITSQLTEGSHTIVVSIWRTSGTSTFTCYSSNSELIVTGP